MKQHTHTHKKDLKHLTPNILNGTPAHTEAQTYPHMEHSCSIIRGCGPAVYINICVMTVDTDHVLDPIIPDYIFRVGHICSLKIFYEVTSYM